jgi:hypothetical protein
MAETGTGYNNTFVSKKSVEEVQQTIIGAITGVDGCTISMAGANSIIVTRKYIPTWAIVVGVLGLACFLVGALAFLYKETETCTIQLLQTKDGTKGTITGVVSTNLKERLNSIIQTI